MNNYELTVVLPGGASAAKKKSAAEKLEKLVKTMEGKVVKSEDWGKIDLQYPIKKENSGIFLYFDVELNGKGAKAVKDKLKLENDIIRYLLLKK